MLAAHDQENLAFSHQTGAAAKQQQNQGARGLQPKTPGARNFKTPGKIPLNDENAVHGLGGKSVLGNRTRGGNENILTVGKGAKVDKSKLFTPAPQTARAPLGNKTTNAKAKAFQTPAAVIDTVRNAKESRAESRAKTSASRARPLVPKVESSKLDILLDATDPLEEEEEVEYCPPRPKNLPYESDVFPDGVLSYECLKPENRLKGYYDYYHNATDENGLTRLDREMNQRQQQRFKELDEQVKKDLDELDWDVEEEPSVQVKKKPAPVPAEKKIIRPGGSTRAPSTIASRKAASALSMAPKTSLIGPRPMKTATAPSKTPSYMLPVRSRPVPTKTLVQSKSSADASAVLANSRSTLGYNKGRSAATSILHSRSKSEAPTKRSLVRSASTFSASSNATLTPASYANVQKIEATETDDLKKPDFLSIFNNNEDEDENDDGNLGGNVDALQCDSDDDFQFDTNF